MLKLIKDKEEIQKLSSYFFDELETITEDFYGQSIYRTMDSEHVHKAIMLAHFHSIFAVFEKLKNEVAENRYEEYISVFQDMCVVTLKKIKALAHLDSEDFDIGGEG